MEAMNDPLAMLFSSGASDDEAMAELMKMLFPFEGEQAVLSQEMALAEQLRQRGPERSTPMGALIGGASSALGNVGGALMQKENLGQQRKVNSMAQEDAASRMMKIRGASRPPGSRQMLPTAVDDELLAALMRGG